MNEYQAKIAELESKIENAKRWVEQSLELGISADGWLELIGLYTVEIGIFQQLAAL